MKTVELTVVGISYRVTPATVHKIAEYIQSGPMKCVLTREPDNVHHANAIKVTLGESPYKGLHIGYLMRGVADEYAPRMDKGRIHLQAWLTELTAEDGTLSVRVGKPAQPSRKTKGKGKSSNRA